MAIADRLGEVRFPVTASLVASAIVLILGGVYWYTTGKISETVLFIAAAGAATGAILGAFYTARGLELTAAALARDEVRYKVSLAFQFTAKWNDPAMFRVRDAIREIFNGDHNSQKFAEHLASEETNVINFLNFLEEVGIAMEKAGADPIILEEAFKGITTLAWSKLHPWVIERRRKRNAPKMWVYMEKLASKWN